MMRNSILIVLMGCLGIGLAFTQVLLKRFLELFIASQGGILSKVLFSLQSQLFWATGASFLACSGLWIWILPRTSLAIAYPMLSFSYVAMLFLAHFLENEPIRPLHMMGVALIVGGVALLAYNR